MDFATFSLLSKYAKEYASSKIRRVGVSSTEHMLCSFLYFHQGVSQDMIASSLLLDKTTVAKALASLEERALITRVQDPQNRRRNILNLTKSGKQTITDIVDIYDVWLKELESCLTDEERQQFHQYYLRLLEKAKEINAKQSS